MIKLILSNKTLDINRTDKYGINSFWIASFYGHQEVMKLLLSKGVDIMNRNQNGSNALHIAVKKDNYKVIQTLIDIHYPMDYTKNNGVTAAGIAAHKGALRTLDMLYKAGADLNFRALSGVNALYLSIKTNKLDCAKYMLERKVNFHFMDPNQSEFSPLFLAIKQNNLAVIEMICDTAETLKVSTNGTQGDLSQCFNEQGYGPLSYAAALRHNEIVNYLSIRVSNLNEEDPRGFSPFTMYVLSHNFDMAQKFLQRGGIEILNYCNREGKTPVTIAVKEGNQEAVDFLLNKGADHHIEDLYGKDTCDYARMLEQFKHQPIFKCAPARRKPPVLGLKANAHKLDQEMQRIREGQGMLDKDRRAAQTQKRVESPIKDPIQIVPISNISLPQIDHILEQQSKDDKVLQSRVSDFLDVGQLSHSELISQQFKDYDNIIKKRELQYFQNETMLQAEHQIERAQKGQGAQDQFERFSHQRGLEQEKLRKLRVRERDSVKDELRKSKDQIITNIHKHDKQDQTIVKFQDEMRNSFWDKESKLQDLQFNSKIKEVEGRLSQLRESHSEFERVTVNASTRPRSRQLTINNHSTVDDSSTRNFNSQINLYNSLAQINPLTHAETIRGIDNIKQSIELLSKQRNQNQLQPNAQSNSAYSDYSYNPPQRSRSERPKIEDLSQLITSNISRLRQQIEQELTKTKRDEYMRQSNIKLALAQSNNYDYERMAYDFDKPESTKNMIQENREQKLKLPEIKRQSVGFDEERKIQPLKGNIYEYQFASQKHIRDYPISKQSNSMLGYIREPPTLKNKAISRQVHQQSDYIDNSNYLLGDQLKKEYSSDSLNNQGSPVPQKYIPLEEPYEPPRQNLQPDLKLSLKPIQNIQEAPVQGSGKYNFPSKTEVKNLSYKAESILEQQDERTITDKLREELGIGPSQVNGLNDLVIEHESEKHLRILKEKLRRIEEGNNRATRGSTRGKPRNFFHHHSVGKITKTPGRVNVNRTLDQLPSQKKSVRFQEHLSQGKVKQTVIKASKLTENGNLILNKKSMF